MRPYLLSYVMLTHHNIYYFFVLIIHNIAVTYSRVFLNMSKNWIGLKLIF